MVIKRSRSLTAELNDSWTETAKIARAGRPAFRARRQLAVASACATQAHARRDSGAASFRRDLADRITVGLSQLSSPTFIVSSRPLWAGPLDDVGPPFFGAPAHENLVSERFPFPILSSWQRTWRLARSVRPPCE